MEARQVVDPKGPRIPRPATFSIKTSERSSIFIKHKCSMRTILCVELGI
jgi:hypothetical protein